MSATVKAPPVPRKMLAAVADWLSGHKDQPVGPTELAGLIGQDTTGVGRALRWLVEELPAVQRVGGDRGPRSRKYVMLSTAALAALPSVGEAAQAPGPRLAPPPPPLPDTRAPEPLPAPAAVAAVAPSAPGPNGHMTGLPSEGMLQIVGVASGHSGGVMVRDHGGQVWMLTPVG